MFHILNLQETFGLDHTHKKGLLSKGAKRFRSWRTYLTKRFVVEQMEKFPNEFPPRRPRGYESIISPEVWLDFVNKRLSNDWKIIREKMQALRAKNEYNHKLSRGGYQCAREVLGN